MQVVDWGRGGGNVMEYNSLFNIPPNQVWNHVIHVVSLYLRNIVQEELLDHYQLVNHNTPADSMKDTIFVFPSKCT